MGLHLLVAFAAARGFAQLFHVSAPLRWPPVNPLLALPRHLPEACAVVCGALAAHLAWLRRSVWGLRSRDDDDVLRQVLLDVFY